VVDGARGAQPDERRERGVDDAEECGRVVLFPRPEPPNPGCACHPRCGSGRLVPRNPTSEGMRMDEQRGDAERTVGSGGPTTLPDSETTCSGGSGTVGVTRSVAVAGSAGVPDSVAVAGSTRVAGSVAVAGSTGVAGSAGVSGSVGVAGSAGVAGSVGVSGSVAVAGSAGVSGSAGIAGSVLSLLSVALVACVGCLGCVGCRRCVLCIGCVDCEGCVLCIGCVGLRRGVRQVRVTAGEGVS
jgi:hypothetical protein